MAFGIATTKFTLARSGLAGRAPGIESNDFEPGHVWQTVGGLLENVAIHHSAMGGKWMETENGRLALSDGCGNLADQSQAICGGYGDGAAVSRQHSAGTY